MDPQTQATHDMATEGANVIGPTWPGFNEIRNLIIFGDSYSSVRESSEYATFPVKFRPLGVTFPGTTWNEPGEPNWVGHLLSKPGTNPDILVYDYALGGHTVNDMRHKIQSEFTKQLGYARGSMWTSNDSLFVTWIGINDCGGRVDVAACQDVLFRLQNMLYDHGARNFLYVDVPPVNRSPAWHSDSGDGVHIYEDWNSSLKERIAQFSSKHPDATVMLFSSYDLFSRLLDNPAQYGFDEETAYKYGGCVWYDFIHPTSQVHELLAIELAQFLSSQVPLGPNNASSGVAATASQR